jgi:histone-lysine N-methyltransferase SUV39H
MQPESEVDLSIHAPRREISYPKGYKMPSEDGTESEPIQLYSQEELDAEMDDCHWCQLAQFSTHLLSPVTITNEVDDATFPKNFRFIEFEEIRDAAVPVADDAFRTGCECEDDGQCEYSGCLCLQDIYVDPASVNRKGPRRKINAYISKGPKAGCLKKEMLESREPLYECHSKCSCSEVCSNRVVERGRQIPLEIFKTADGRGWGM